MLKVPVEKNGQYTTSDYELQQRNGNYKKQLHGNAAEEKQRIPLTRLSVDSMQFRKESVRLKVPHKIYPVCNTNGKNNPKLSI